MRRRIVLTHVVQMDRLLRNRVSAQQARERKKAYLANLEQQTKIQQMRTAQLEDRNKTLEMEVMTLRALLKTYMGNAGSAPGEGKSFDEVVSQVTQIVSDKMVEWHRQNQQRMMALPHGAGGIVGYRGHAADDDDEEDDEDDDDDDDDDEDEEDD